MTLQKKASQAAWLKSDTTMHDHHAIALIQGQKYPSTVRVLGATFIWAWRVVGSVWKGGFPFVMRTCCRTVPIFANFPGHLKLARVLALPGVIGLTERCPQLAYKYLGNYLGRNFCRTSRLGILTNHYSYLANRVKENFLVEIFDGKHTIWQEHLDQQSFEITITFPREHDYEGDLCLIFECDRTPLYEISFTIAAARFMGIKSRNQQALLVTNIQGAAGKMELIRQATKICHGTSPVFLLLAAAEAIALSLDIEMIAGVGLDQQTSKKYLADPENFFDYDGFWRSFVGEKASCGFYLASIPFTEKPLEAIKSNRRSRVRRRRELRSQICARVRTYFENKFLKHPGSSAGAYVVHSSPLA